MKNSKSFRAVYIAFTVIISLAAVGFVVFNTLREASEENRLNERIAVTGMERAKALDMIVWAKISLIESEAKTLEKLTKKSLSDLNVVDSDQLVDVMKYRHRHSKASPVFTFSSEEDSMCRLDRVADHVLWSIVYAQERGAKYAAINSKFLIPVRLSQDDEESAYIRTEGRIKELMKIVQPLLAKHDDISWRSISGDQKAQYRRDGIIKLN